MRIGSIAVFAAALLGGFLLQACEMGMQQPQVDIPPPITCGPGTYDTGNKCTAGSCGRR